MVSLMRASKAAMPLLMATGLSCSSPMKAGPKAAGGKGAISSIPLADRLLNDNRYEGQGGALTIRESLRVDGRGPALSRTVSTLEGEDRAYRLEQHDRAWSLGKAQLTDGRSISAQGKRVLLERDARMEGISVECPEGKGCRFLLDGRFVPLLIVQGQGSGFAEWYLGTEQGKAQLLRYIHETDQRGSQDIVGKVVQSVPLGRWIGSQGGREYLFESEGGKDYVRIR